MTTRTSLPPLPAGEGWGEGRGPTPVASRELPPHTRGPAAFAIFLAAAATLVAAAFAHAGPISVGPTVQVSRDGAERPHEEVILGAHPTDPTRLIGCSIVDFNRGKERLMHAIAYTTEDGGAHWKKAVESTEFDGDPMCGYGPDGQAYFLSIGTDDENHAKVIWWIQIFRSEDGGRTWSDGKTGRGGDRPYLAFDNSSGPMHGYGYVVYSLRTTAFDKKGPIHSPRDGTVPTIEVLRSKDGWKSWEKTAVGVLTGPGFSTATGAAVLSDGSLATLWLERFLKKDKAGREIGQTDHEELYMTLAAPGADLFGRTVKVADLVASRPFFGTFYSLAKDATDGPRRDRLYVAWTDTRTPHARILVSASSDRGATWSAPKAVNVVPAADTQPFMDDYMPTVAVNKSGVVGLTWRRRLRPEDEGDVFFTASIDGGTTWLPGTRVSSARGDVAEGLAKAHLRPEDDEKNPTSRRQKFHKGGDTSGLAADADGVFHALWTDQRSGIGQVYTVAVTVVEGVPMKRPTQEGEEKR